MGFYKYNAATTCLYCQIIRTVHATTRTYFAKLISINHEFSSVRTDDISGTNFRPDQTNIKGSDGLPLRRAVLRQRANPH